MVGTFDEVLVLRHNMAEKVEAEAKDVCFVITHPRGDSSAHSFVQAHIFNT